MANRIVKAHPRQLRTDLSITRQSFVHPAHYRPGVQDTERWRIVASEPVNKMARRMIQREISSLNFKIRPEDPKDDTQRDAALWYSEVYKDFRSLTTRTLKSICELPQGGAWEIGKMTPGVFGEGAKGTLAFVEYIDAGTLHPTVDRNEIVQIDPHHTLRRKIFQKDEIVRILGWPRDDFGREWWQESPTEAAFMAIEALARIYVYSLKQLMDTPVAGILDMMDFSEEDASAWAMSFKEMLTGIDPIKIPILYEHNVPVKWVPIGNNFDDLAIPEQFKMYADMVLGNYGLSIGDLRIFDHNQTKAGSAVSRKITLKQGVNFFAELIKDAVQSTLPPFLIFEYTEPDLEDERTKAQIRAANARTIATFDFLPPRLKALQAQKDGVLTVDFDPEEIEKEMRAIQGMDVGMKTNARPTPGQIEQGEGRTRDALEDDAKTTSSTGTRTFAKGRLEQIVQDTQVLIEKAVDKFKQNFSESKQGRKNNIAAKRFEELLGKEFRDVGKGITAATIRPIVDKVRTQFPELLLKVIDEPMEAKSYTDTIDSLATGYYVEKQNDADSLRARVDALLEELLADEIFYNITDEEFLERLEIILRLAYEDGLLGAAEMVQGDLFQRGEVDSPFVKLRFNVTDPFVLNLLGKTAADMVKNVNNGTKSFLRRLILEGAVQGQSVDVITDSIHKDLFGLPEEEAGKLNRARVRSIVTTELNRADSMGRLKQMTEIGLKLKRWITRLTDVCALCLRNEAKGSVSVDFLYEDVFKPDFETLGPPGHPATCHCSLGADKDELSKLGTEPDYWIGQAEKKSKSGVSGIIRGPSLSMLDSLLIPGPKERVTITPVEEPIAITKKTYPKVEEKALTRGGNDLFYTLKFKSTETIKRIQDHIKDAIGITSADWEDPSKFHITLVFIPDINVNTVTGLSTELLDVVEPVDIEVDGFGTFSTERGDKSNVLFLDVRRTPELDALQLRLHDIVKSRGLKTSEFSDPAKWRPHVTLAYADQPFDEDNFPDIGGLALAGKVIEASVDFEVLDTSVEKFNPYHEIAGAPGGIGGQFATAETGVFVSTGQSFRQGKKFAEAQAKLSTQIDAITGEYATTYKRFFKTDNDAEAAKLQRKLDDMDALRNTLIAQRGKSKQKLVGLAVDNIAKENPNRGKRLRTVIGQLQQGTGAFAGAF